ncbi:MAK10-like protein [Tanacetum coccineum]
MHILIVQSKLHHLDGDYDMINSLILYIRSVVVRKRVEDAYLGVESYHKKLNLTKPMFYVSGLQYKPPYTSLGNPKGVVYRNKRGTNMLIRYDEVHKFSDGTLKKSEDPNQHLKDFLKIIDSFDLDVENRERTRLHLFQFFLRDQARNWLERLPTGSISTWEDLTTPFLAQFFPLRRIGKLRKEILMFQQHQGEFLSEAWTRFKDLLQKVNPSWRTIDQSTGGKLHDKNAKESWALIKDLALYDNESWNGPRDFSKPVKAISLPYDVPNASDRHLIELENQVQCLMEAHLAPKPSVQVNKIASSCEICSGPRNTQYYMENPEQGFVDYASLRSNEVGEPNATKSNDHNTTIKETVEKEQRDSETVVEEGESNDMGRNDCNTPKISTTQRNTTWVLLHNTQR